MSDKTDAEVAKNSGDVQEVSPDPTAEPSRTPETDTRPPEEKGEESFSGEETPGTKPEEKPAPKTKRKPAAKKPAAKPAAKTETKPAAKDSESSDDKEFSYEPPSPSLTTRIQRALGRHGYYYGPADGKFEEKSVQGVQRAIQRVGYTGPVNGTIDEDQAKLVQQFAKKHGSYGGPLNKKLNDNTWAGFAVALERLP